MSPDAPASEVRSPSPRERAAALAIETARAWAGDEPCSIPNLLTMLVEARGLTRDTARRGIDDACDARALVMRRVHPSDGAPWYVGLALPDAQQAPRGHAT
jgi:hypothetical protein